MRRCVVGLVHLLVAQIGTCLVRIKAVGILHDELPAPHHAETGPDLVAKLGLDLIEVFGKLP